MKNKVYSIEIFQKVKIDTIKYLSDDGKGRLAETVKNFYHLKVVEVEPSDDFYQWYREAYATFRVAMQQLHSVSCVLRYNTPEINLGVVPVKKWALCGGFNEEISLTKGEYEQLKPLDGNYIVLTNGIKGFYFDTFTSVGLEPHRKFDKYGFDRAVGIEQSPDASWEKLMEIFPENVKNKWDYRYMPEF